MNLKRNLFSGGRYYWHPIDYKDGTKTIVVHDFNDFAKIPKDVPGWLVEAGESETDLLLIKRENNIVVSIIFDKRGHSYIEEIDDEFLCGLNS